MVKKRALLFNIAQHLSQTFEFPGMNPQTFTTWADYLGCLPVKNLGFKPPHGQSVVAPKKNHRLLFMVIVINF